MTLTRQILPDQTALTYVRDALTQGRGLSNRILDLDLEKGTIWAYLRQDVPLVYAQAHLNEKWLIVAESEAEPVTVVDGYRIRRKPTFVVPRYIEFIQHYMERSPHGYCVFEEALGKASDPYIAKQRQSPPASQPIPYAFQGEGIYYVLKHESATLNAITEGLKETHSAWIQTVVLSSLPADIASIDPWTEINPQQMSALVSNVEAFLVSAFDGVGYVVWESSR